MTTGPINFTDLLKAADDAGFSVVPADTYEAEVATAEAATTGTGKNQIKVRFKIIAGPQAGKSVFNNFVIVADNPNALGFFFRNMAVLGVPREFFASNPPLADVARLIVGKRAAITVSIRQWNGQDRNQVDGLKASNPAGVGATPFVPGLVQPQSMPTTPPLGGPVIAPGPVDAAPPQTDAPKLPF